MDMQDITTGSSQATYAETARRWSRLVLAYGAPGADALLDHVPEHIRRPVDPSSNLLGLCVSSPFCSSPLTRGVPGAAWNGVPSVLAAWG